MKYRILIYIQPWEIDDFERQLRHLILGSYSISKSDEVVIDTTLNISDGLIDWDSSKICKEYFLKKYEYLKNITNQYFTAEFDTNELIQGCVDKRRLALSKEQDFIIWLDPDLFFDKNTLYYLIEASKIIKNTNFILSPQTIKYWDYTWDCLTHSKFINEPTNHRDYFDMYSIDSISNNNDVHIKQNDTVKIGGGWFNLFPTSLFEKIPIPIEFGSYGWEDLYVMLCCTHLKIPQYLIDGIIVSEIGKKLLESKNYYRSLLNIKQPFYGFCDDGRPITVHNKISSEEFNHIFSNFINNNKTNIL